MTDQSPRNGEPQSGREPRDTSHWARYVEVLKAPEGAVAPSVEGHRLVGPLQGFGKMWQKAYKVRLVGASATPAEVVEAWRTRFPELSGFGESGCRVPSGGLVPGAVRSEEHTSELQSRQYLVCRLLLEKKKDKVLRVNLKFYLKLYHYLKIEYNLVK